MKKTTAILAAILLLSGCCTVSTTQTTFKDLKTGGLTKCGGCASMAVAIVGIYGYEMERKDERACYAENIAAGRVVVSQRKGDWE